MKNNKVLLLILATTFSPFLIAAILTTDYFSQQLEQKQFGEFLTTEFYLPSSVTAESSSLPDHSIANNSMFTTPRQWQLVISPAHKNYESFANKLTNIKTALGKRSDLVNVLSTDSINTQPLASTNTVYIATPKGQLLLAYRNDQVGKPLFKDLNHLLRSNN
jgi:hypothetical protein